ncbi:GFA family protein [Alginatibacterium sediminis]|uniref:GFA family protein n=1 Tax=Alginatibacterium sediminis TaxID=2164068 RepID=A0A420EDD5_9ALTE|nr:GFA family protein [Alginatibacterium sediminis]RKF18749.1 GFA family protein [Alginatibacterium sediminis]
MEFPIEASCQCGQVKYSLKAAPKMVVACHCQACQKLATSPFSITGIVASEDIEFSGKLNEWTRTADSGNSNTAAFCPGCGNRIYHYNPQDLSTVKLKLKPMGLSDDSLFKPTAHFWVCEKLDWVEIPDGVKQFDKQP